MLTVKQPVHYGYKSVHDLPTPPSTSRPSPPLIFQESGHKPLSTIPRSNSPSNQPMSGPPRGLPPPAAMTLAQQPHPSVGPPPPPAPGPPLSQAPQQHGPPPSQMLGQLPPPPQWQQGAEDSMRAWLVAKTEEEKRRAEEEKTQQERIRLEQRRIEQSILQTSLSGGIPPPMVPVVFAGMGGGNLPQAALDWAHQFMYSQTQQSHQPQLLPAGGPTSPGLRRDSQAQGYGPYAGSGGVPSTPGSAQGPHSGFVPPYPGSPTRPRGYSVPGPDRRALGGGGTLPSLNTNVPQGQGGPGSHPSLPGAQQQQEPQPSPSIYFHHWQPPTSQASGGSSNQPVGQSPRKRKTTEPQQAAPPPNQRYTSPTLAHSTGSTISNPPPGRRRGHSRQRSDLSAYRPPGRGRTETFGGPYRGMSPLHTSAPGSAREAREAEEAASRQQIPPPRSGAHSVSSLLSEEPSRQAGQYPSHQSEMRAQQGESERRNSPHQTSEEKTRGGAAGSAAKREGDND